MGHIEILSLPNSNSDLFEGDVILFLVLFPVYLLGFLGSPFF